MVRDWRSTLADPGYTPGRADLRRLLAVALGEDKKLGLQAERAIAKLADVAVDEVVARLPAREAERARLIRLVGRLARTVNGEKRAALGAMLLERLDDDDAGVRRQAIVALGGLGGEQVIERLAAQARREGKVENLRALARALGHSHDSRARASLEALALIAAERNDPQLERLLREANVKVLRGETRGKASEFLLDHPAQVPLALWLHLRAGLEPFALEELPPTMSATSLRPGLIAATLREPLAVLCRARIPIAWGFPLEARGEDLAASVVQALTSERAWQVFSSFTRGDAIRFRIEWAGGGKRRGSTMAIADAVQRVRPTLINDPTASDWEAVVAEEGRTVVVELRPRGLPDTRFAYRKALLPAGSHPTIAAALARAARVGDDVVWDPFVGSATELIECAVLAPGAELFGCDTDPQALEAARTNLEAAGVRASLVRKDARAYQPKKRPTVIVSNPPMGRRVSDLESLAKLFGGLIPHAAALLAPGGRMVWLSALPRDTALMAKRSGLTLTLSRRVDMGGFSAELQRFDKRS